jgi:integrase/recombinase XerC
MMIEAFLDYLRFERNYSEHTVVAYETDLRQFGDFLKSVGEELDYTNVDSDLIRSWVVTLMDSSKSTSVNRKLSSLRSFYRFLMKRGKTTVNPLAKITGPKNSKPLPTFLRENDMDRLLDEISYGEGFEAVRDRMILETFYATGMRLSELVGLNDTDVDFSAMQMKVTGKRNKQRLIPFAGELAADLREYIIIRNETIPERSDAFFVLKNGKRMYPEKVYGIVRRNLAKVVSVKKKSPHVLRHTFATAMLNHEAELKSVKELLGHESLATTEIYTHTTFEELKKVYEQAHPRA